MRWELNCGFHIGVGRIYILTLYFMLYSEKREWFTEFGFESYAALSLHNNQI
jgi:hypothetical protein